MKWIVMFIVVSFSAVVQTAVPALNFFGAAKPPFSFCVVLYYSLEHGLFPSLLSAFLLAILQSALSPAPFFISFVCFIVVGALALRFRRMISSESVEIIAFSGFIASMLGTILFRMLIGDDLLGLWPFWKSLWKSAGSGLIGAIIAPLLFVFVGKLDRHLGCVRIKKEIHGYD